MKILDADGLRRSLRFLEVHARPLDQAIAAYYFRDGSVETVRTALRTFQNPDGGFGNAIEPDFRLQPSSPLATTVGLQYARALHLQADDPIVQGAVRYLLDAFDAQQNRWHAVPAQVNDVPHAPWWTVKDGRCGVEGTWANPSAEVLGYLWQYQALVPADFLTEVTGTALAELGKMPDNLGMHEFLCYQRLSEHLPQPYKSTVLERLQNSLLFTVDTAPERWSEYGAKPLQIVPSPASPFAALLWDAVQLNLDYELETMNADGSWSPNWSWFGNYDEIWPTAAREWQGHLTFRTLKSLADFGRIPALRPASAAGN